MKLSELRILCDKTIGKYGDMDVGAYSQDYSYDLHKAQDLHSVKFRILAEGGDLPGENPMEADQPVKAQNRFACLFFDD